MPTPRRTLLKRLATFGAVALFPGPLWARTQTPRAAEGPFYPLPDMRRRDVDNDLVRIAGQVREAGGEVMTLRGQITDAAGTPLSGLRIEIWQCDVEGRYMHPGDRRSTGHDPAFQGFGHDVTDARGGYRFRTIKPTQYPGRTPHIHVKVLDAKRTLLTTQFYLDGHPANASDGLYRRMTDAEARAVTMRLSPADPDPEAVVNVVV